MPRREIAPASFLSGLPLFKELDAATLARLASATGRRALKRGETLFRKGDPATGMYVVVFGEIKLLSHTPARGTRLSGVVGPRQSFGEPVMFLDRPALVEARAGSDALLLHLPKEAVFAEIERDPKFARRMLAGLSKRVERLVHELDRQATGSGSQRVLAYLQRLARGAPGAVTVTLPAAKVEIAGQLNLTPEHLSRILRELAEAGVLQVNGRRITLGDPAALAGAARSVGSA